MLLLFARPVTAQPADCERTPIAGPVAPLAIDLIRRPGVPQGAARPEVPTGAGRPGVPEAVGGLVIVNVPIGAPSGLACHDDPPPPPRDVLHGAPGDLLGGVPSGAEPTDVLSGRPSPDLLRGPGQQHIEIEFR
jgi:hypothetical protein